MQFLKMKKTLYLMILSVSILHLSTVSKAQETKNTTYNFTLTAEDLNIIGKALDERPFKEVAPLLQKLNTQIQNQIVNKEKEQATGVPPNTGK